jgi:hypothetical protein
MDNKTQPLEIYNVASINNYGNEKKYTSNEETIAIKINNRAMNFLLQKKLLQSRSITRP